MGKLTKGDPSARELVTEILDETRWWKTLRLIVGLLGTKSVDQVRIEFGSVWQPGLKTSRRAPSEIIQLSDLETVIRRGLDEGIIEWAKTSDFCFYPVGTELALMLCNDADLHLASNDSSLLLEFGREIVSSGGKVYDSGHLF
jgi:hypothetical protein